MYDEIVNILENKINFYKININSLTIEENEKYERLQMVYELLMEDDEFFSDISMDIAYKILQDIGIDEDKINSVYVSLIKKESVEKNYIMVDPNQIKL